MTFEQLQKYLDEEKWNESSRRGVDMCGRYARCRYCDRFAPHPCASAHNKLLEMRSSPVPDVIPDWLLPEPPVAEKFGTEIAVDAPAASMSEGRHKWTKQKPPMSEAKKEDAQEGKDGQGTGKGVRLFILRKKGNALS